MPLPTSAIFLALSMLEQSWQDRVLRLLSPSLLTHLHQEVSQGHKGGSVLGLVRPALQHDIVNVLGTVLRPRQPLTLLVYLVQDLWDRVCCQGVPDRPQHQWGEARGQVSAVHLPGCH